MQNYVDNAASAARIVVAQQQPTTTADAAAAAAATVPATGADDAPAPTFERRHLVARTALAPGTVLFASAPAALVMTSPEVCAHCMSRPRGDAALKRCGVCKTTYCGAACQRTDWAEHRGECKLLGGLQMQLKAAGDFEAAVLLSRLARGKRMRSALAPAVSGGGEGDIPPLPCYYTHSLKDVAEMAPLESDVGAQQGPATDPSAPPHPVPERAARITAALRAADLLPPTIDDAVAAALLSRIAANTAAVTDAVLHTRGVCIAPCGSLLRHSCAPNTVTSYIDAAVFARELGQAPAPAAAAQASSGPVAPLLQVLRTIAEVGEGEELTQSLVDVSKPLRERRRLLAKTRGIAHCACPRCAVEEAEGDREDCGPEPSPPLAEGAEPGAAPLPPSSRSGDLDLARLVASSAREMAAEEAAAGASAATLAKSPTAPTRAKLLASGYVPPPPSPKLRGGGGSGAGSATHLAILLHALCLYRRWLPPYHPDVMRVVDEMYGAAALGQHYALAAALGEHNVAFYTHALRRLPGGGAFHPALALQWHALGDLYLNKGVDRAASFEEEEQARARGEGTQGQGDSQGAQGADAAVAKQVAAALVVRPGVPGPEALPEAFFAAAGEAYSHSSDALTAANGRLCPLALMAGERVSMCGEIVREAEERFKQ